MLEGRFAPVEELELARLEGSLDPPDVEEQLRRLEGLPEEGPLGGMVSRSVHCRHSQTLADTCRLFEGFVRRAPEVSIFHM